MLPKLLYYVYEAATIHPENAEARQRHFFGRVKFFVSTLRRTMETLALILFVLVSQIQDIIDFLTGGNGQDLNDSTGILNSITTIGRQFAAIAGYSSGQVQEDFQANLVKALGTLNQYLMSATFEIHMHLEEVAVGFTNQSLFFYEGRNPFTGAILNGAQEGVTSSGKQVVTWPADSNGPEGSGFFETLNDATKWLKTMQAQADEVVEYRNQWRFNNMKKRGKAANHQGPKMFNHDLETAIVTQNAGLVFVSTHSAWLQLWAESEFVHSPQNPLSQRPRGMSGVRLFRTKTAPPCYLNHEWKLQNFGVMLMRSLSVSKSDNAQGTPVVSIANMEVLSPGIQTGEKETYKGLGGTPDNNRRSSLLSRRKTMISDETRPENTPDRRLRRFGTMPIFGGANSSANSATSGSTQLTSLQSFLGDAYDHGSEDYAINFSKRRIGESKGHDDSVSDEEP